MTKHFDTAALRGSTALVRRGPAPERKDADPATVSAEVKKAVEDLMRTFEQFKAKNDERLGQIEKKGTADVVTKEEVERINKAIDEAQDRAKKRVDELEAKLNRQALGGGDHGAAETKAAADFAALTGRDVSVDDYRAYKSAMYGRDGYLRKGEAAKPDAMKAMYVGSDPDGGYLAPPDTTGRIVKKIYETSPIRQYATVVTLGTDQLEGPIDNGEAAAGWVGEQASRSETGTPQLGKWVIAVNEMYAMPKASQKVLDDAQLDLEGWLTTKAADKFTRVENAAYVVGDGILKPQGLTTYSASATSDKAGRAWGVFEYIATGTDAAFPSSNPGDKLLDLVYALKSGYRQNARWLCNRATVGRIRKFKDGQGNYLWVPGAQAGQPSSLLNYPVVEGEDMPDTTTSGALALGFGDIAETYTIVDRSGITVLRDPYTQKGWVLFYARRRTGGGVVNFESFKWMKFATS